MPPIINGQSPNTKGEVFDTPGQQTWTCPTGVDVVLITCIGGGGGGTGASTPYNQVAGGGGGLAWATGVSVVPGRNYSITVGAGGTNTLSGGDSVFGGQIRGGGGGAGGGGGTFSGGIGGGNGGNGGGTSGGGGGAGGYNGTGGRGGEGVQSNNYLVYTYGIAGTGGSGGGGGGAGPNNYSANGSISYAGPGGGTGLNYVGQNNGVRSNEGSPGGAGSGGSGTTYGGGGTNVTPGGNGVVYIEWSSEPGAPTVGTHVPGNGQITFNWTAPTYTGGSTIKDYYLEIESAGTSKQTATTTGTSYTFTGLTNGVTYYGAVYAHNQTSNNGPNIRGTAISSVPGTVTDAPIFDTTVVGNGSLTFNWFPAVSREYPARTYTITCNNSSQTVNASSSLTATFDNLTNGTSYTASLIATNEVGNSPASTTSATPATTSDSPTFGTTAIGNTELTFNWTPPAVTGGVPITGYTITCAGGSQTFNPVGGNPVSGTSARFIELTNGTVYTATIVAINANGNSPASTTSATPATTPGSPTFDTTTIGNTELTFNWTQPAVTGGRPITGYTITCFGDDQLFYPVSGNPVTGTSARFMDLTNGVQYTATIVAINAIGNSSPVTTSATPAKKPGSPTFTDILTSDRSLTFEWTPPSDGGSPITGYTITCGGGGQTFNPVGGNPLQTTRAVFTGLVNGILYTATLVATNALGNSASAFASATPATRPSNPTFSATTIGDRELTFNWTLSSDGGSAITGYTITCTDGSQVFYPEGDNPVIVQSARFVGLTNGIPYTATLVAANVKGQSDPVTRVSTPMTVSNTPVFIATTVGNRELTFRWNAPTENGGSPVTEYTITCTDGIDTFYPDVENPITDTFAKFSQLTNGTEYTATLVATNQAGNSNPVTRAATPGMRPDPPVFGVIITDSGYMVFNWTTPFDGGSPITGYTITCIDSKGRSYNPATGNPLSQSPASFYNVENGEVYNISLVATNAIGNSDPVITVAQTPAPVPNPVFGTTVVGDGTLTFNWSITGSGATRYIITCKDAAQNSFTPVGDSPTSATSATFVGLTNGTAYTATIYAIRGSVASSTTTSAPATPTDATVSNPPAFLTTLVGDGTITFDWAEPYNGGSPITGYNITCTDGIQVFYPEGDNPVTTTYATFVGLTNGTAYTGSVYAINGMGNSSTAFFESATPAVPATAPGPPTFRATTVGNGTLTFNWNAPTNNGGSEILGYTIVSNGKTQNTPDLSSTFTGLTNGTAYTAALYATNIAGNSGTVTSESATPATAPSAPTFRATTVGNGALTFNWNAPTNNGGSPITGYTIIVNNVTRNVTTLSSTFTGLTNGTAYTAALYATNTEGNSSTVTSASATPVAPATAPGPPTFRATTVGNGSLTFNWNAPANNGGSPITRYTIIVNNVTRNVTTLSSTFTGLRNGTAYTARLVATNAKGNSTAVTSSASKPTNVPNAPVFGTTSVGNGTLTFRWSAPTNNGGSAITGYTIVVNNVTRNVTTLSSTFTGLRNGTAYTARLYAKNRNGNGSAVTSSASKPTNLPNAPVFGTTSVGNGTLTFRWSAPTNNGGSAITGYTIVVNNVTRNVTTLSSTFTGLRNGTAYTARLYAKNRNGNGTAVTKTNTPLV